MKWNDSGCKKKLQTPAWTLRHLFIINLVFIDCSQQQTRLSKYNPPIGSLLINQRFRGVRRNWDGRTTAATNFQPRLFRQHPSLRRFLRLWWTRGPVRKPPQFLPVNPYFRGLCTNWSQDGAPALRPRSYTSANTRLSSRNCSCLSKSRVYGCIPLLEFLQVEPSLRNACRSSNRKLQKSFSAEFVPRDLNKIIHQTMPTSGVKLQTQTLFISNHVKLCIKNFKRATSDSISVWWHMSHRITTRTVEMHGKEDRRERLLHDLTTHGALRVVWGEEQALCPRLRAEAQMRVINRSLVEMVGHTTSRPHLGLGISTDQGKDCPPLIWSLRFQRISSTRAEIQRAPDRNNNIQSLQVPHSFANSRIMTPLPCGASPTCTEHHQDWNN
jgi:hypothetical protein